MNFKIVGVIGVGNIGSGIVGDLVLHGIHAVAVDTSEETLEKSRTAILQNVRARRSCRASAPPPITAS